jgi:Uma2 family endonuclease
MSIRHGTNVAGDDGRIAAMSVMRPRVSFSDLQHLPEDGPRYELYDGEAFVVPAPFPGHQRAVRELLLQFDRYAAIHGGEVLGSPIDIVFSEFDVLQPDLVYFQGSRRQRIHAREAIRSAPDLVVEVISPGTEATDRGKKMRMFARYGVREYWLVDPDARTIDVYALAGEAYGLAQSASGSDTARSTVLEGFSVNVRAIFDRAS